MRAGRWQARFTVPFGHPSGRGGRTVTAPHTFEPTTYGKEAAGDWLRDEERRLNAEGAAWATLAELAEAERAGVERESVVTFGEYSAVWLRCLAPQAQSDPPRIRTSLFDFYNAAADAHMDETTRLAKTIDTWWPAILTALTQDVTNARTEGSTGSSRTPRESAADTATWRTTDDAYWLFPAAVGMRRTGFTVRTRRDAEPSI